jgi:hypothetical protein
MTTEIFLRSDDSCSSTLLDPTVGILSEVFLGSDNSCPLRDFGLRVILSIMGFFSPE